MTLAAWQYLAWEMQSEQAGGRGARRVSIYAGNQKKIVDTTLMWAKSTSHRLHDQSSLSPRRWHHVHPTPLHVPRPPILLQDATLQGPGGGGVGN